MSRRGWWRTIFLGITSLVIGMELVAAWDGNEDTDPWTELVVTYVPWEVATAVIGALALWVPAHFGIRYWRRARVRDGADR